MYSKILYDIFFHQWGESSMKNMNIKSIEKSKYIIGHYNRMYKIVRKIEFKDGNVIDLYEGEIKDGKYTMGIIEYKDGRIKYIGGKR